MITFNGKEYRNLEEQVLENMQAIEEIHDIGLLLAQLGIKVVGQVDTAEELPDPTEYHADDRENHYGDAFAVGTTTPYYFYLFTRAFEGETDPKWFSIGRFPLPGPKGDPGSGGGASYTAAQIDLNGYTSPSFSGTLTFTDTDGEQSVLPFSANGVSEGTGIKIEVDNDTGYVKPSIVMYRHHIAMSENQTVEGIDYEGVDVEFDVISTQSNSFGSWSNLCAALNRRSTTTLPLAASGRYCSSPYSGVFYSNVFITKALINPQPQSKTMTVYGRKLAVSDADYYDYPLKPWDMSLTEAQCSFMAFSDSVRPFPDVTSIN